MGDPQNAWFIDGKVHENPIYKWTPILGTITVTYIPVFKEIFKFDHVWHSLTPCLGWSAPCSFRKSFLAPTVRRITKKDRPNPQQIRTFQPAKCKKIHQRSDMFGSHQRLLAIHDLCTLWRQAKLWGLTKGSTRILGNLQVNTVIYVYLVR